MDDRVAVVTGGGSGIGGAAARLLLERGLTVAVVGRDATKLASVAGALAVPADLHDPEAPRAIVQRVLAETGRLDVLVNCAASYWLRAFEDVSPAELEDHLAVNVRAAFFLIQEALPALRRSPAAAIVNVSSAAAVMHRPQQAAYGLSKAALEHLTLQLAAELAPDRIRVNAVRPGPVETGFSGGLDNLEERMAQLARMVPLGRVGQPDEVARWIVYLVDPEASWVTGAIVPVDGGRTLGPPATV